MMVPFPMCVNNQRLFQEFAEQTPKLNGKPLGTQSMEFCVSETPKLNGFPFRTQSMEFCVSETPKLNGKPFSSFQRNRTAKAVLGKLNL